MECSVVLDTVGKPHEKHSILSERCSIWENRHPSVDEHDQLQET